MIVISIYLRVVDVEINALYPLFVNIRIILIFTVRKVSKINPES